MDDKEPNPDTRDKPGYKALLAKQYMAVKALADPDDPEVQAYLADLERVLKAPE
jgi:hypothetical protein